jgi:hypothetical protein
MGYIERNITSKDELLSALDVEWRALRRVVDEAEPEALTAQTDAAGWTSTDHLAHLAVWARSVVRMVREGIPRWEGLGISRAVYETPGWDEKNEVIRQNTRGMSSDAVMAELAAIQRDIVAIVGELTDVELNRPLAEFADGGEGETLIRRIVGTFPDHYEEHRGYIGRILNQGTDR